MLQINKKYINKQIYNVINLLSMYMNVYVQYPEMTSVVSWRYRNKLN